jgi:Tfp pilus assembly protein PilE
MIRFFIFFILTFSFLEYASAAVPSYTRPTRTEIETATRACFEKGKPANEKYKCPAGNYTDSTSQILSQEIVECSIQMSLSFSAIDEAAKKWAEELQKQREPDFNKWNESIKQDVLAESGSLRDQYLSVCNLTNWVNYEPNYGCARSTNRFPEAVCRDIAIAKAAAWRNA